MVVSVLYFLVALALIYPIYLRSVRLNREQPEIWELEKELESRGLTVNKSEQGKFAFFRVMV